MGSINGFAYLIIGVTISIVSYYIDAKSFMIFFWIGIIFALYGLLKVFFIFLKSQRENPKKPHMRHPTSVQQETMPAYNVCNRCRIRLHPKFNFCPKCGARIQ